MKAADIAKIVEEFAPLSLQESYDNSGFTVGRCEREVYGVLKSVAK
ncbi:MAG: Nif3-like dinuclear metal center hexameric protein, partial [Rikenellaceae bacterium]